MNGIFRNFLDKFIIVFLDDILIYSITKEEHEEHMRMTLQELRENHLYAKLRKFSFCQRHIQYLGKIILKEGILVDTEKIKAIK